MMRNFLPNHESPDSSRMESLDVLKAICAFGVVYIHCGIPTFADEVINVMSRVAVPLFFMVTGFYFERTYAKGRVADAVRKLLGMLCVAITVYWLKDLAFSNMKYLVVVGVLLVCMITGFWFVQTHRKSRVADVLKKLFWIFCVAVVSVYFIMGNSQGFLKFLALGWFPLAGHLWYLHAAMLALIMLWGAAVGIA